MPRLFVCLFVCLLICFESVYIVRSNINCRYIVLDFVISVFKPFFVKSPKERRTDGKHLL